MIPLHQELLGLLSECSPEELFSPEGVERVLATPRGQRLLRSVGELSGKQVLLAALRSLAAQRDMQNSQQNHVEFVVTTPGYVSSNARDTETVLLEMIGDAQRQIFAIGYSITSDLLKQSLQDAAERGVDLIVVTDRGSMHGPELLAAWPAHLSLPRVYCERISALSAMAKMHGKALFVDGSKLFISSANFSWHGLNANLEFGVVISGSQIAVARDLFEEVLIESSLLERIRA